MCRSSKRAAFLVSTTRTLIAQIHSRSAFYFLLLCRFPSSSRRQLFPPSHAVPHVHPMDTLSAQAVDPAIVAAAPKVVPPVPKVVPHFPLSTSIVVLDETVEGATTFDYAANVAVKCSNDVVVSLPRASANALPFLASQITPDLAAAIAFPYSSQVLVNINHWVEKKGLTGKSSAEFVRPLLHTDMSMLLADDWEIHFLKLISADSLVATLNAVEKLGGMKGLHDFALVTLSCELRGATDEEATRPFALKEPLTAEEIAAVDVEYPWFKTITAPH